MDWLRVLLCVVLLLALCVLTTPAQAGVISTTGSIVFTDPAPPGLTLPIAPGALESNDVIRLFYFRNFPRSSDEMDICQPGTYNNWATVTHCYLPGDFVGDMAYIYFDPIGTPASVIRSGSVTFETNVVAILAGGSWGLELNSGDTVTFSADRRTVGLTLGEGPGGDQVVVYLNSVPEPGTLSYISCALLLMAAVARRVSRKRR